MRLVAVAAIFACRSSAPPISCELAGDHVYALSTDKGLRLRLVDLCTLNEWSESARGCVAGVRSLDELRGCELGTSAAVLDDAVRDHDRRRDDEARRAADEAEAKRRGIAIDVPSGNATTIDPRSAALVVELDPGTTTVAGKVLASDGDLDNLFRVAYTRDHAVQVVFKASRDVKHARVIELMERAKQAGITHLAIATR